MSQIKISNLTFSYDEAFDYIFQNASFEIDTSWKLGLIGRNGRGKTTFLKLLMNEYEYIGNIIAPVHFDYYPQKIEDNEKSTLDIIKSKIAPFEQWEKEMEQCLLQNTQVSLERYGELQEYYIQNDGYNIEDYIKIELEKLKVDAGVLTRSYRSLSNGEQTKVLLAALFLKKNNYLLIDEPTNHLDTLGRTTLASYLKSKKGFILISHDRVFLNACINHVLSINKSTIEVMKGDYSTWQYNKDLHDKYELEQNEKLKKEVSHLKKAKERTENWADKIETGKIGNHVADRGRVGHMAAKMMKRSKAVEKRQHDTVEQKNKLLKNIDESKQLKINIIESSKKKYLQLTDVSIAYGESSVCQNINFILNAGDRISLTGKNGSGKTSLLKVILGEMEPRKGEIWRNNEISISYISQDTSYLKGGLQEFATKSNIDYTLFLTALRQLDFPRSQFEKEMQCFSEGQKKKVLIAKSLVEPSSLFIWDEPLNYIDILSRIQIEELILKNKPTMLFIEHDKAFTSNIVTKIVEV